MKRLPIRFSVELYRGEEVGSFLQLTDESDSTEWANALLNGYLEIGSPGTVLPRHKYIEGGAEERKARYALARVLRSEQPDRGVLEALARMAAPSEPPGQRHPPLAGRMLTFKRRVKQSHTHRNEAILTRIARKLYELDVGPGQTLYAADMAMVRVLYGVPVEGKMPTRRKGISAEAVFEEVAEEVGLTYEVVEKIWKTRPGAKRAVKPARGI